MTAAKRAMSILLSATMLMDDKFHTLESDEFALSTSLGMYDGKKQKDEAYEEEQVHFYIDAEGEDALEKSYRYQLENYGGIFKESNVFSHLEETQDGLYKIPFEMKQQKPIDIVG
jgi:hypothetical protein